MRILFVNWKDWSHPQAGGAEVVLKELCKRLIADKHQVSLLTAVYPIKITQNNSDKIETQKISPQFENLDGISVIRTGQNKFSHSLFANFYYQKNLVGQFDLVVEMVNTAPYFLGFNNLINNFWANLKPRFGHDFGNIGELTSQSTNKLPSETPDESSTKKIELKEIPKNTKFALFYHQLAREIWWLETKFPLSFIGFYLLEPIATWLQSLLKCQTITISQSSKNDLARFGFNPSKIAIISEGIDNEPLKNLQTQIPKEAKFTLLYHGSLRSMKRPLEVLESFLKFKMLLESQLKEEKSSGETQNLCQLWVSGKGEEMEKCQTFCQENGIEKMVKFWGRTSDELKLELMQKSHLGCVTSIKEGWGLVVTETNSMGTPYVVYDVDGLRDSGALDGNFVVANSDQMAQKILEIYNLWTAENEENETQKPYTQLCQKALNSTKKITFENCYKGFCQALGVGNGK